jgi:dihydrodipicolinate synthase/N-acetylneuraminate lyase
VDKRAAKRTAHRWVSDIIHGALVNGSEDDLGATTDEDYQRVLAAIKELADEHERKAYP